MHNQIQTLVKNTHITYYHLCNGVVSKEENVKAIYSLEELNELQENSGNAVWLVFAHLTWNNKEPSFNFGFDIARKIRLEKKSKSPIILYSPIQKDLFVEKSKSDVKYKILNGRGIAFIPINELKEKLLVTIEDLNRYPLSSAVLTDMNEMLLNQRGAVIDKLTHDLKFGIEEQRVAEILNESAAYLDYEQQSKINLPHFQSELISSITDYQKI